MCRSDPQADIRTVGPVADRLVMDIAINKFRCILWATTSLLLSFALAFPTLASPTKYPLSYSGRIVDDKGQPALGQVDLEFSFFDADQGGNLLGASPYQRRVTLVDGVFQVTLDLLAADVSNIFANGDAVWIEVKDVSADKIYPRQRFTYVPYAMRVPVDGTTIGYDATTGQLKVLSASVTGVTAVSAGTGLIGSTSNGAVTLNVDVGTSANKIVQLDSSAKIGYGVLPVGTTSNTVAAGNDARLNDARTPTGTAGGDLSGSYPNPILKSSTTTDADRPVSSDHIKTGAVTNDKLAGAIVPAKIATDASNRFVTDVNISAWTTAASWGNHASAGYLTMVPWATPDAIGSTTPAAGTFTALEANTALKLKDNDTTANYVSLRAASSMANDVIYTLPAVPEGGKYLTTDANGILTWNTPSGSGDMLKATYDSGNDGKVDTANNAEKLNNQSASYYTDASNLATGTVAYLRLPVGAGANTIAAGDDARFSNERIPTGAAGGDLSGTYPNPTLKSSATVNANRAVSTDHIKDGAVTLAKLAADAVDSSKIANGSIIDDDIASNAAIADSKLATISSANKVANSATSATSNNTNNAIVARDGSGNFSANIITANLTGDVTGNVSGTASNVTGTVAVVHGGTGATTPAGALNNLLPSQTGNSGRVLQSDGTNASWAALNTSSWDTAYTDRLKWDGGASGLNASTGRTSLGLGSAATLDVGMTANKVVQLDGSAKIAYAVLPVGAAANTIAAGDDSRLTNARAPTGAAGGDLSGTYPDPMLKSSTTTDAGRAVGTDHIKTGAVTLAKLAADAVDSSKIANGSIMDADLASSAAIADSKLATISSANKVANSATTATNLNTASAIVARDASGNFSAGTITANLSGNVTGNLTGNVTGNVSGSSASFTGSLSGDVSGTQSGTSVTGLQGRSVESTAPTSGQVLTWSGSAWSPQTPASGSTVTMVTKSADYTVSASDAGKYFLVSGSETTLTLPTAASFGSGATVTIKSTGVSARVLPSGSDLIDGEAGVKVRLTSRSVVQLASDGSNWFIINEIGGVHRHLLCGANCYDTAAAAWASGYAYTAQNKFLDLNSGVWVQADGTNVLRVDGTDNWHYALNLNGKGSSTTALLSKTTANLAGRACPTNVYVDDTNKVAEGRCLYYDAGNSWQRLDAPNIDGVSDQMTAGSIRIGNRASAAGNWYEGNIQTCANKGMRLPVLYETTASAAEITDWGGDPYKPTDASPTFSGLVNGVPSAGDYTWTASAYTSYSSNYWMWSGTSASYTDYNGTYAVRCVVQ